MPIDLPQLTSVNASNRAHSLGVIPHVSGTFDPPVTVTIFFLLLLLLAECTPHAKYYALCQNCVGWICCL